MKYAYYSEQIPPLLSHTHTTGSDVFSTSTDGQVLWWDIRKLVEPVETLSLEYAGYKSGLKLGGIVVEYESTMVRKYHQLTERLCIDKYRSITAN